MCSGQGIWTPSLLSKGHSLANFMETLQSAPALILATTIVQSIEHPTESHLSIPKIVYVYMAHTHTHTHGNEEQQHCLALRAYATSPLLTYASLKPTCFSTTLFQLGSCFMPGQSASVGVPSSCTILSSWSSSPWPGSRGLPAQSQVQKHHLVHLSSSAWTGSKGLRGAVSELACNPRRYSYHAGSWPGTRMQLAH